MIEALTFNDVLIVPKFSTIKSRKDVDLSNGYSKLPIISANMDSVTGATMAKAMKQAGGLACLHRFWSIEDNVSALRGGTYEGSCPWVSVGLGVKELERAEALYEVGARHFIIDVANGAQMQVVDQYKALHELLTKEITTLCVGNFATYDSINTFRHHLGYHPNMVKIGIGPGNACTTRIKTGVGVGQLTALLDCGRMGIDMIADGGCREVGDIAKALACKNVKMVMLGGMLAGTYETPGEVKQDTKYVSYGEFLGRDVPVGLPYKTYRGSASKESYIDQGKNNPTPEGESFTVEYKGPVNKVLEEIKGGLQSSFSYVDARNLTEFQNNAEFIRITNAGYAESLPHGKK